YILTALLLGFLLFLRRALTFLDWIWAAFLRPPKDLKEHYGSWAVLTGPTDGIGKALAFELASRGLNLVLVGRSPSKLRATTDEIMIRSPHVEIRTVVLDLARSRGEEILGAIRNGIEGLDVGILVNNAGVGFPLPMFFHEMDAELVEWSLRVNVDAATWVAKAVVPAMLRKGRGAVVNVGSGSSVVVPSYPLMMVYGATKAYVAMLSRCMSLEYKQHGIDIQCQVKDTMLINKNLSYTVNFVIPVTTQNHENVFIEIGVSGSSIKIFETMVHPTVSKCSTLDPTAPNHVRTMYILTYKLCDDDQHPNRLLLYMMG
ncbi:unnamed protein product, partial [Linum tenue]